jgi:chromosome partitioning protein
MAAAMSPSISDPHFEGICKNPEPRKSFDWVVIDCPPALGVLTANAVDASDVIIIPCQMGARALDGLEDLLELVHLLKGETFADWWILLTMYDNRKAVTREIFEEMLSPYKDKV